MNTMTQPNPPRLWMRGTVCGALSAVATAGLCIGAKASEAPATKAPASMPSTNGDARPHSLDDPRFGSFMGVNKMSTRKLREILR